MRKYLLIILACFISFSSLVTGSSTISHCLSYYTNGDCKTCASGYYVDSKDTCSSCESHCSTCTSSTRCTKCNSGYFLSSYSCYSNHTTTSLYYSTVCLASHCYKCKSSNRYYCIDCDFGYSDFDGQCLEIEARSLLVLYIILSIILPIIIIITIIYCIIYARRRRIQRNVIVNQPVMTAQAPIQMIPVQPLEYQQNFQMPQFGYNQQQYGSPQMCQVPEPVK